MPTTLKAGVAAALAAALLSACGSDGPVREPAELLRIESPAFKPKVLWSRAPGDGSGEIHTGLRLAVELDVVVTADIDGDVYALDPRTGARLWHQDTDAPLVAGPGVSGDLVLLGTQDAEVIALKRASGEPVWRSRLSSEVLAPPVGSGNVVVVRCGDGKIFGLSASDGSRLWNFDRNVPPLTLRGLSAPVIDGNTVFIGLDNGRAVALKLETGEVLWETIITAPSGRTELERIVDIDADLLVINDGVFAVSYGGEVAAASIVDGRVAWRRPVKSYTGVSIFADSIAVTAEDGLVWYLDARTGAARWSSDSLKYRGLSAPVIVNGFTVVADAEGYLHWLAPEDGRIVARLRAVDGPVTAPLVLSDQVLYLLDTTGEIAAIDTRNLR